MLFSRASCGAGGQVSAALGVHEAHPARNGVTDLHFLGSIYIQYEPNHNGHLIHGSQVRMPDPLRLE